MIAAPGFGHASLHSGFLDQDSKGQQSASDRLVSQTNIQTTTDQDLARAVSPIVEISLTENFIKKSSAETKTASQQETSPLERKAASEQPDNAAKPKNDQELTEEEEKQVQELKKRDAEVKAHEQAHAAVGGSYASAPTYEYTTGPDNKQYAIGGEVQIDSAPVPNNPEATIRKMDIVIRAALAPAEPSSQDKSVASQAQKTRSAAQAELAKQQTADLNGEGEEDSLLSSGEETDETSQIFATAQTDATQIFSAILAYKSAGQV